MSEQSRAFDEWMDRVAAGEKLNAGEFARSAIGELPKITVAARPPTKGAWPPEVWAEMQRIWNGEESNDKCS